MIWRKQNILIVLILLLFYGVIFSQNSIPSDQLIQTKEIIILNTDRKIYLTGDEIWFSIANVNAYSHKASELSKIVYIELYYNKSVVTKKIIRLSEGRGSGVIQIPPGQETGYYTLRAYTNWMKNFSKSHYTNYIIPVVNPLAKSLGYTSNSIIFRSYPESGNLVPGTPNKIYYSVVSQKDIKSGVVLDNANNLISTFKMNNIDIGSFTFIPEEKEYTVLIKDELDSIFTYSLPVIRNDQDHLYIQHISDHIEISILRPRPAITKFLEIAKFDSVFYSVKLNDSKQKQVIRIEKAQIPYGTSIVQIKDLSGNIQCVRPILNVDNTDNVVTGLTNKSEYNTREKVELTLNSEKMNLSTSISVRKKPHESSFQKMELIPLIFFDKVFVNNWHGSSLDNQTWEEYMVLNSDIWRSIHYSDNGISFTNPPEYNGHLVKGMINSQIEDAKIPHEIFLNIKGDPLGFYTAQISKDRYYYFPVRVLPVNNSLILSNPNVDFTWNNGSTIFDPFDEYVSEDSLPSLFLTNELLSYLEQSSLNNQLKYAYSIDNIIEQGDSALQRFGNNLPSPNSIYFLDKYTRFPVMEEVLREIIRNVRVRISRGNYSLNVVNNGTGEIYNQDPLILLDGLPVCDINRFMNINPLEIESIEVVNTKSFVGQSAFDGVIYVKSYKRDYAGYLIDSNYYVMKYYNIEGDVTYLTPDYSNDELKNSRIPDFRNLLSWHPCIQIYPGISKKIEFYTSDEDGIYEIQISGINKDGSNISLKSDFEVIKSN